MDKIYSYKRLVGNTYILDLFPEHKIFSYSTPWFVMFSCTPMIDDLQI